MFVTAAEIPEGNYLRSFFPPEGRFREHMVNMASRPHDASTPGNERVIDYLSSCMRSYGLEVDECSYDVLLSHPVEKDSFIHIVKPEALALKDKEDESGSAGAFFGEALKGFNSYSPSADITGPLVYANYGRIEDFEHLKRCGINVSGKIVLIRYGKLFRGKCVVNAERNKAAGVVFYSDPADYAGMPGQEDQGMQGSAIQRGNILDLDHPGDPLTPGEPAYTADSGKQVRRLAIGDLKLPEIPVAPLSWEAASELFTRMKGTPVPGEWKGGLPLDYTYGDDYSLELRLSVKQELALSRITDVLGTVRGSRYPDERIIMGSHFDSWGFGAVDPISGTAMLLVVAEALGNMKRAGFSFDRTISIAHWDGEESGIMGSTEWIEEHWRSVEGKTLVFVNADGVVSGPTFGMKAVPLMKGIMEALARALPYDNNRTFYEQWKSQNIKSDWRSLGGGSDHVGFLFHHGVPSCLASLTNPNPVYHSLYDNLDWYAAYADPSFLLGNTLALYFLGLAYSMSQSRIIPYSINLLLDYIDAEAAAALKDRTLSREAFDRALAAARTSLASLGKLNDYSDRNCRRINMILLGIEKIFLKGKDCPSWYRSMLYAPDEKSGYGESSLPFVAAALEHNRDAREELDNITAALGALAKALDEMAAG